MTQNNSNPAGTTPGITPQAQMILDALSNKQAVYVGNAAKLRQILKKNPVYDYTEEVVPDEYADETTLPMSIKEAIESAHAMSRENLGTTAIAKAVLENNVPVSITDFDKSKANNIIVHFQYKMFLYKMSSGIESITSYRKALSQFLARTDDPMRKKWIGILSTIVGFYNTDLNRESVGVGRKSASKPHNPDYTGLPLRFIKHWEERTSSRSATIFAFETLTRHVVTIGVPDKDKVGKFAMMKLTSDMISEPGKIITVTGKARHRLWGEFGYLDFDSKSLKELK